MRETVAFDTFTSMRIWAYVRRSRRNFTTSASKSGTVLRGWSIGTQDLEKSLGPSPSSRARCTQRRAVFSLTIRAAAAARMVSPLIKTSRAISARVNGVSRALACILSVWFGGRFAVHPPPSWHILSMRTTCCNKTANQSPEPMPMAVTPPAAQASRQP